MIKRQLNTTPTIMRKIAVLKSFRERAGRSNKKRNGRKSSAYLYPNFAKPIL